MKRRNWFWGMLLTLIPSLGETQDLQQVEFQGTSNPPKCFFDNTPLTAKPVNLVVNDDDSNFKGNSLAWPVMVCPKCGALQCVQIKAM